MAIGKHIRWGRDWKDCTEYTGWSLCLSFL